ncbi:hypothetical protein FO519_002094 [Halicephalobus sp. NKZ332]|nr:hypothetical protein FO519_002094 [Halicephalobus sp. NKZ332]
MADASPPASSNVDAANNTYKPTFEDQMIAYSAIYTMAIICVVWGSIRSLHFVRKLLNKKKLVETSLLTSDALKFPLTASIVLFTLYVFFKGNFGPEAANQIRTRVLPHLPPQYHSYVETAIDYLPKGGNETTKFNVREKISNLHPSLEYYVSQVPEVSKDNLIVLLLWLITFEGVVCLATLLEPLVSFFLKKLPIGNRWPRKNISYYFVWKSGKKEMAEGDIADAKDDVNKYLEVEYTDHWLFALLFTSVVGFYHIKNRHWITNNLIGIAFSIMGIENLHLASFKAGCILLCGLFFYDIFWVFGTDVMTTVAKSINAPILLMFPQDLLVHGWRDASKHGMLGLGDIVIPGIFIALLHRFDNHVLDKDKKNEKKSRYYFIATVFAYMIGLFLTIGVMHFFKAAQPALLYLVPSCLLTPMLLALIRGEFSLLWNYTEEQISESYVEKQKAQKEKESQKKAKSGKKD